MTRPLSRALLCILAVTATAAPARAQLYVGRDTPRAGSMEVSGGGTWAGGYGQGTATAQLTRNPGTGGGSFDLFTAETELGSAPGVQGKFAFYLTRTIALEAGVQYSRPVFSARLANDAELAEDATAEEIVTRYIFDGSVVLHFGGFGGGRGMPFVLAGGGYIRELHDGFGVVETGNEFHGGLGLKYWFTQGRRRFGLRVEAGAMSRSGGADAGDGRRTVPTAAASLAYLF